VVPLKTRERKEDIMALALTNEELEKIQCRCDNATPGPWISSWEGREHTSGDGVILRGDQRQDDDLYISPCTLADQNFIAHAREDVLALVDELLRLREILKVHGLDVG
jgi:hypothetical protein